MSQGNRKVKIRKMLARNNKVLVCNSGSLIQPALFQEIPATNYETFVCTR